MSALWSARALRKSDRRIVLELRAIHPDSGEFSTAKPFALRLLYDEAYGYGPGSVLQSRGPLGEAVLLDQTFNDAFMAAHVDQYVEQVAAEVHKPRLDPAALSARIDQEVADRGVRREAPEAFAAAREARWKAFWAEPANLPHATYTIDVTDPRWLAHLSVGQAWDSAAY